MKRWGHTTDAEESRLNVVAHTFIIKIKRARTRIAAESSVRTFMCAYLKIGDDPLDTIIRDNVWLFLIKNTKHLLTKDMLNTIWIEEIEKDEAICVIS